MAETPTAIEFDNVTKTYFVLQRATPRLGAWVVNKVFEHFRREPFHALEDVSLSIPQGQMLGLLGVNGAGKSTALKLMAGISQPSSGTVRVRGRVASMLELGVGFHPDLSGMENIFYSGAIMGMSRAEILERLPAIIEFSGLEPFIHEPVKHYSSGMYARLAVSVALHVEPDIVLMDEILAVGDAEFQQRGLKRVLALHEQGKTIVLVTHVIMMARMVCERFVWLEQGRIRADGEVDEVGREYMRHAYRIGRPQSHILFPGREVSPEAGPRIERVRMTDASGSTIERARTGEDVHIEITVDESRSAAPYRVVLSALLEDERELFHDQTPAIEPGSREPIVYSVPEWPFLRGQFQLAVGIESPDGTKLFDVRQDALTIQTETGPRHMEEGVLLAPKTTWTIDRID